MKKNYMMLSIALKESDTQKGKYGWFDSDTNEWFIPPIYTFNYAMCLDFEAYFRALESFKPEAIKIAFESEHFNEKLKKACSANLCWMEGIFKVKRIKNVCENFNSKVCRNKSEMDCMRCDNHFIDWEKSKNKGGKNE